MKGHPFPKISVVEVAATGLSPCGFLIYTRCNKGTLLRYSFCCVASHSRWLYLLELENMNPLSTLLIGHKGERQYRTENNILRSCCGLPIWLFCRQPLAEMQPGGKKASALSHLRLLLCLAEAKVVPNDQSGN